MIDLAKKHIALIFAGLFGVCVFVFVVEFGLNGCASAMISGGDAAIVAKGSSMRTGSSYSQKLTLPPATANKYPIRVTNFSSLTKEVRDILINYVNDRGNFLPVTISKDYQRGSQMDSKHGFGGGYTYQEMTESSKFNFILQDWREQSAILLEFSGNGSCTGFHKEDIGKSDFNWYHPISEIAEYNSLVDLLNQMENNRSKIDSFYKEYLKTKENF